MVLRNPSPKEFMHLEFLVGEADLSEASEAILESLKVADIDDGGMGSLRLFPKGSDDRTERIGKRASTCQFTDEDGVEVVASLNLDKHGNLYELDMWKADFGKLIRIPFDRTLLRREEK